MNTVIPPLVLESHVRSHFAGRTCIPRRWHSGPAAEMWPALYVVHVEPKHREEGHVFVSIGAANLRDGYHRDFAILANDDGEHHVETLFMIAYYHHFQGLDVGHTLPIGRPWRPGASCDHFLVSLPYPLGQKFELLTHDGHEMRFLWLLPIFESEATYRHSHGLEALEKLFDTVGLDVYGKHRRAVV